ncbi:MAG TPA: hypothetical protein VF275_02495 [Gammaproteobacteria bacterium]
MTFEKFRRIAIYSAGAFFILVLMALFLKALTSGPEREHGSGPECMSSIFGLQISNDNHVEGVAVTNCESGSGIQLSYHLSDQSGNSLDYEGIRFPTVAINNAQIGFFRIPLNSLRYYAEKDIEVRFDWVREGLYWFSEEYRFTGEGTYRFSRAGNILSWSDKQDSGCGVKPVNFDEGMKVDEFEQLTSIGAFRASIDCALPDSTYLTYHVLDEAGHVLQWDVANVQGRLACVDSFGGHVRRIADSVEVDETNFPLDKSEVLTAADALVEGPKTASCLTTGEDAQISEDGTAQVPVKDSLVWGHDSQPARIAFDVLLADGDGMASFAVAPAFINIDATFDRIETVISLIPRILPASDYVLIPALVKVERDSALPTPFRASVEIFDAVNFGRYETERNALSTNPENVYQFRKISFRSPPKGVWHVNLGYVFDPYVWYSTVYPPDRDRVLFVNPLGFMMIVLLSLFVLRGLLRFFKEERRWYGKVLAAGAMLGVIGLFSISALLSIAGFSALMVYSMLKFSRSRHRFRDPWFYFLLMALAFGFLMEAFWSVHYADIYRHGVILSACLHAFVALLIVLIARKDLTRRIALAAWFAVSGTLYLVVVSYLKFFGEPPRYSVYQYAGQAIDVADSALVLLSSREWLGIGLIIFSVVLVLVTKPDAGLKMMFARFRKG